MKYLALEIWVYFPRYMYRSLVLTQDSVLMNRKQILANSLISHTNTSVIWNNVFVWTNVSYLLESLMTVGKRWCCYISPIFEKCIGIAFLSRGLIKLFYFYRMKAKPNSMKLPRLVSVIRLCSLCLFKNSYNTYFIVL